MNSYEREHIRDIVLRNREISGVIDSAMRDIAKRLSRTTVVSKKAQLTIMSDRLAELKKQIQGNIETGVRNQWNLANNKSETLVNGYLSNIKISDSLYQSFVTPNINALNAFLDRAEAGMNLSKRVWEITDGINGEMKRLIKTGVLEGKSAIRLSRELKGFVKGHPIRYAGKLIPGRNLNFQAIRLAATEMNMAFRMSDHLQNSRLPFVTSVTIELSASHPVSDICDELAGEYPKGFQFVGWHPLCMCIATYNNLPPNEFVKYIKTGEINQSRFTASIPVKAQSYIKKNGDRLLGYKNTPYWLRDNFDKGLKLKKSVLKVKGEVKP